MPASIVIADRKDFSIAINYYFVLMGSVYQNMNRKHNNHPVLGEVLHRIRCICKMLLRYLQAFLLVFPADKQGNEFLLQVLTLSNFKYFWSSNPVKFNHYPAQY